MAGTYWGNGFQREGLLGILDAAYPDSDAPFSSWASDKMMNSRDKVRQGELKLDMLRKKRQDSVREAQRQQLMRRLMQQLDMEQQLRGQQIGGAVTQVNPAARMSAPAPFRG